MSKTFIYDDGYQKTRVALRIANYVNNNNIYVGLDEVDENGERIAFFTDITKNVVPEGDFLEGSLPVFYAPVDTNNNPEIMGFLMENNLATATQFTKTSGWCVYPVVLFDKNILMDINETAVKKHIFCKDYDPLNMDPDDAACLADEKIEDGTIEEWYTKYEEKVSHY